MWAGVILTILGAGIEIAGRSLHAGASLLVAFEPQTDASTGDEPPTTNWLFLMLDPLSGLGVHTTLLIDGAYRDVRVADLTADDIADLVLVDTRVHVWPGKPVCDCPDWTYRPDSTKTCPHTRARKHALSQR